MGLNLKTVEQFCQESGVFTKGQINGWIADDSTGFRKEVVCKAGRKTLLDVDKFPAWFEKFSDKNKAEHEKRRKERAAAKTNGKDAATPKTSAANKPAASAKSPSAPAAA